MDSSPDMDRSRYSEPDLAADLTAFADGSLDPARRAEVAERVARSPEMKAALTEQQQAIALLSRAAEVTAPEAVRQRVQELGERSRIPGRLRTRRPPALLASPGGERLPRRRAFGIAAFGGAALAAAAAAIIAVAVSGGSATAPGLHPYLTAAARPATIAAPAESAAHRNQLAIAVGGVAFPYWEDQFGWRATGARSDRIGGRAVTTVFYTNSGGSRIRYSIVAGPPPRLPRSAASSAATYRGGVTVWHDGVRYWLGGAGGARVLVWTRSGHGCILSGRGVSGRALLTLASWSGERRTVA
jgi:anti-sigma factor RsiW